jgi:hypothetical protein
MKASQLCILITIGIAITFAGCVAIRQHIASSRYKGDGSLHYERGPLLGRGGWVVSMPQFDLSKGLDTTYNISGLPRGDLYCVTLVVSNPCPITTITKGQYAYTLSINGSPFREVNQPLSNLVASGCADWNRFWYYRKDDKNAEVCEYCFNATNLEDNSRLSVKYMPMGVTQRVMGHISIEQDIGK